MCPIVKLFAIRWDRLRMVDSVRKAEADEIKSQISADDESVVGLLKIALRIFLTESKKDRHKLFLRCA